MARKLLSGERVIAAGLAEAYRGKIIGRMVAEGAQDVSSAEVERCLAPCVCGVFLIGAAHTLWILGRLTDQDVRA